MAQHKVFFIENMASPASIAVLMLILITACWTDIQSRRIPNWLICLGFILSVGAQLLLGTTGVVNWALGLTIGFGIFFPLYLVRAMGAGDVKLMGVVGAFLGPTSILSTTIIIFIVGGCFALLLATWNGVIGKALKNVCMLLFGLIPGALNRSQKLEITKKSAGNLPFAVSIFTGSAINLLMEHSGHLLF